MLNLVWNWLCENNYKINFWVVYHKENKLEKNKILEWWINALPGLTLEQCKCYIKKSQAKNKDVGKMPYGCGNVCVYSVEFFYKVMGGIEFLKKNFSSKKPYIYETKEAL